jgi:transcriptional regulator with XRE-family HTH domain
MILGYRIRKLRKDNNMSQADLGKRLGISKVSVSGYEKGTRKPGIKVLIRLLDTFDVSADYLLGREINAVCEDEGEKEILLSSMDIKIINEIKARPNLYNEILEDPKRFFAITNKKNI